MPPQRSQHAVDTSETSASSPSGHYQASYWHEGQRHTAPVTFKARADGLAHLAKIETSIRGGGWIDPSAGQVKLSTYSAKWLAGRAGLAERTVELYRYLLDSHIEPTFGTTTLASITPSAVRNWHAELATRPRDHGGEGLSPALVDHAHGRR